MAITFPRGMPAFGLGSQKFELERMDYLSPTLGGEVASVTAGWPLWKAQWTFTGMSEAEGAEWRAWIASLRGSQRLFFGADQLRPIPRAYRDSGLGAFGGDATSWSVNADRDVLGLSGLPSGFTLLPDDYIGFRWGANRRTKVRVLEAATGSSLNVSVEPPVPMVVPGSAVATVKNPECLMRLTPETSLGDIGVDRILTGSITAVQTLLA